MSKINIWRIASGSLVGILAIGLFLPIIIQSYVSERLNELQPAILREFNANEKQKLYLFNQVSVKEYRLLSRVINCESRWQANAYNSKSKDWGLFQINQASWNKIAEELGYDYKTNWQDNINFGLWIYKNYGIKQWDWSKNCWN